MTTRERASVPRVGIVTSHPIQYQAPWFRALAKSLDLHVYFAQRDTAAKIAANGYGVPVTWDIDLLGGYSHSFLNNVALDPDGSHFGSCDTPEIFELLRDADYDAVIVNGWYLKSYIQTVVACRRLGTPVLVRGDSRLMPSTSLAKRALKRIGYPVLLKAFAGCLYVGQRNREYLEHYGVPSDRLFFVPHAVDNSRFAAEAAVARSSRTALRRMLGFRDDEIVALFVGRLVSMKRPLDLLKAAELMPPSLRIRPAFVGAGELEGDIRQYASRAGLTISLLGFKNQSELPAVYAAADFVVLPSNANETWGLVVNEAMAAGTPALVSDAVGCCPDMVIPGLTGEVFELANAQSLADAMSRFAPRLGTAEVRHALTNVLANFSIERAVEGTVRALSAVTKTR